MDFSFNDALQYLGPNAAFKYINQARPDSSYLFATILPEEQKETYHIDSGFMTVRTTMAGLAGMSSPYAPGGIVEVSTFLEKSSKITIEVALEEEAIRAVQTMMQRFAIEGGSTNGVDNGLIRMADEAFNFYNKLVVQAHTDTAEWLRGQALRKGKIDWTYNGMRLLIDYGVPATFLPAQRTGSQAYDQSGSMFWTDHYAAIGALLYNVRCVIMHVTTFLKISQNPANNFNIINSARTPDGTTVYTVQRYVAKGAANLVISNDFRDTVQFIVYDLEGEVLDPLNPTKTMRVPFCTPGDILYIANNNRSGYRVGEGSTPDPLRDQAIGYTHIAPTVEGGGKPGRWGDLFIPEKQPWSLHGRGVCNMLPVREDVGPSLAKTYTLTTVLT